MVFFLMFFPECIELMTVLCASLVFYILCVCVCVCVRWGVLCGVDRCTSRMRQNIGFGRLWAVIPLYV